MNSNVQPFLNTFALFHVLILIFSLSASASASTNARRASSRRTGSGLAAKMSEAVERAIDATKRRQPADYETARRRDASAAAALTPAAAKAKAARAQLTQPLDVPRLNRLIKAIDASWTMPKRNARNEPVGSNFQFKKTCASIYKARQNACQQPGFGVMCFNFCYEQGEQPQLRCEDVSDAFFCKSNAKFEELLIKYRKDAYRAKSYIHQMMSRCYATAICDGGALLNATDAVVASASGGISAAQKRRLNQQRQLRPPPPATPAAAVGAARGKLWPRRGDIRRKPQTATASTANDTRRRFPLPSPPPPPPSPTDEAARTVPVSNRIDVDAAGAFEAADEEEDELVTPKYVPFWQRLLARKRTLMLAAEVAAAASTTSAPQARLPPPPPPPPSLETPVAQSESTESQPDFPRLQARQTRTKTPPPRTAAEMISRRRSALMAAATTAEEAESGAHEVMWPAPVIKSRSPFNAGAPRLRHGLTADASDLSDETLARMNTLARSAEDYDIDMIDVGPPRFQGALIDASRAIDASDEHVKSWGASHLKGASNLERRVSHGAAWTHSKRREAPLTPLPFHVSVGARTTSDEASTDYGNASRSRGQPRHRPSPPLSLPPTSPTRYRSLIKENSGSDVEGDTRANAAEAVTAGIVGESAPAREELTAATERGRLAAFWKKFRPAQWFRSIYYFTNTG